MNLVTDYYEFKLERLGYPTESVYYSLNHCQGDGMAFYGTISGNELLTLANRLLKGADLAAITRAVKKANEITITIEKNGFGHHYSHYNTMTVYDSAFEPGNTPFTAREERAWDEFVQLVKEDVINTSQQLESDGYALIDACNPVKWYKGPQVGVSKNYDHIIVERRQLDNGMVAVMKIEEDEDFDLSFYEDDKDGYASMIKGEWGVCSCGVEVFAPTGLELGSGYCGGVTDSPDGQHVMEILNECLDEALHEAKDTVASIMKLA